MGLAAEGSDQDLDEYVEEPPSTPHDSDRSQNSDPDETNQRNPIGPNGEIYGSSESEGVSEDSEMVFIPRKQVNWFKETHGLALRTRARNPGLFTKGTTPFEKEILKFVLGENIACP